MIIFEDDYRVCSENDVIKKDADPVCPIDANGRFTTQVPDFQGIYVKVSNWVMFDTSLFLDVQDADKDICKMLKDQGRLVKQGTTKHNYPFCWRSDTPLIYRAVPSWFVRVQDHREALLRNNAQSYW